MKNNSDIFADGTILPLVEEFYTLQGEGFHTGKAAYFIRVGGCDVCCNWCDIKASWNAATHPPTKVSHIVANAAKYPAKAVVVTGGEPLNYNLDYLCNQLKLQGIRTFLETSGSSHLTGVWDWVCLSPKKNKEPLDEVIIAANELKVIIEKDLDFQWAERYKDLVGDDCKLYLQPEWSSYEATIGPIVDYILNNPWWNISLQSHKFMHIP